MKLGMQVGLGPGHTVLGEDPAPPKGPNFWHIYCAQMAAWIKMPPGTEVGLGGDDIVLDGDPALPPQKGGRVPQFSAHLYCGQTAGCIKMPLGTEVGLGQNDIVLHGDPAPPKRAQPTQFLTHVYCG